MKKILIQLFLTLMALSANAQCEFRNTAFKGGEFLHYNLYYNWQFVWIKAGTASLNIIDSKYKGQPSYRASLMTKGSPTADKFFVLRDTLLAYCTQNLAPLYFRKGAEEGKYYAVDEVFYSYEGGVAHQKQHRQKNSGEHVWADFSGQCVYDMLNIFLRARSFDPANWKKGYMLDFPIADGVKQITGRLKFCGRTTVKADDGNKYKCLELSYMEKNKEGKYKELVRFFVTDDKNHVPIRLDLNLRIGSAKAFLVTKKLP